MPVAKHPNLKYLTKHKKSHAAMYKQAKNSWKL